METALAMQYRRGRKKLQVLALSYEGKYNICGLIRVWDHHITDATAAWRFVPALGMPVQMVLGSAEEKFRVDAGIEDVLQSAWVTNGAVLEISQPFEIWASEATDLKMDRVPKSLFTRLADEVDNWA